MKWNRRTFVKLAAAALAADPLCSLAQEEVAHPAEPLRAFAYGRVQLTGGPLFEQYNAVHAHYLALSNDRLLKVYRQRAGLAAPGADMGGWYDLDGFVPGHSLGQYVSGLARIGACTGDAACHRKVHELVEGFAATLGRNNQSILRPQTNLWICYTLDKHFAGLIDAATLSGVDSAGPLLSRVLAGSASLLPAQGRDRIGKKDPPYDETFVMPENLLTAAELTGNPAFRELGERYLLDRELFDPLAAGRDPFPGQHAYSHAIALSSAGKAFLSLGDTKYRRAMEHAFHLLTTGQQFASGGWGPNETFITPHKGELYASLRTTVDHFETPCGAYASTKLARYLIRVTDHAADTRYADYLERVLYNTILAVKAPDSDGGYPYYSTYSEAAQKVFYPKKWPCCSGTLVQTVADYPLNVYFKSGDGLYINQQTPSRLRFRHAGVEVEVQQETGFPVSDSSRLTVNPERPATFTIYLRIPAWTAGQPSIAINGDPVAGPVRAGTFHAIRRRWRSGDRMEITVPQDFRTEAIDDLHPGTVALMRGPVQYVALNPPPMLSRDRLKLSSSLEEVAPQTYLETYGGVQVIFVPLYQVQNATYTSYFDIA